MIQQLKATVYKLAEVSTIKQLKTKYNELEPLDMRYKTSWEKAQAVVQQHQQEFANWLENPPHEYKELFAQIERVSEESNVQIAKFPQIKQVLTSIAEDLEALADEIKDESNYLGQQIKLARQRTQQVDLN